jgi:hypothetical protein
MVNDDQLDHAKRSHGEQHNAPPTDFFLGPDLKRASCATNTRFPIPPIRPPLTVEYNFEDYLPEDSSNSPLV